MAVGIMAGDPEPFEMAGPDVITHHLETMQQRRMLGDWHFFKWLLDTDLFRSTFFYPLGYKRPAGWPAAPSCPPPHAVTLEWLLANWAWTRYYLDFPPFRRVFFPPGEARPAWVTASVNELIRPTWLG